MSTKGFRRLINEVTKYILENSDRNYILIGENTSGKSELLSSAMKELKKDSNNIFYFIDSVNRTFHLKDIGYSGERKEFNYIEIRNQRMDNNQFNKLDTFGMGKIESIYWMHEIELKELIKEFFNLNIDIKEYNQEGFLVSQKAKLEIKKNGRSLQGKGDEELNFPNGMQAVLRIFLELLFFKSNLHTDEQQKKAIIFIEELDLYLSENYSSRIFNFLEKKFPEFRFVISTHSRELTLSAETATVIAIKGTNKKIVNNGENYQLDVDELFADIFHTEEISMHSNEDELDRKLRILLNRKISESWEDRDKKIFEEMLEAKLLPHQKFLMDEIERWTNG